MDFFASFLEVAAVAHGSKGALALLSAREAAPSSVSMWRQLDDAAGFSETLPLGGALADRVLVTQVAPATGSVVEGNSYALVLTNDACSDAKSSSEMYT